MDARKEMLLRSAARLYRLGVEVETAREALRTLAEQGVPYQSKQMRDAYEMFSALDKQWKELEQAHLALRSEILDP